ncbi:MAG: phenylacetate--CoA ligase family protein [Polyangiaceae bacterium]|nr:phenylacetate--CoA ligase family protein [Polyangiaceae bacterium]
MPITPSRRALDAYRAFVETDLDALLTGHAQQDATAGALALFRRVAAEVPAYAAFLGEKGVDPAAVRTPEEFARLPLMTKADYLRRYPLPARCRGGVLTGCDMVAVSSGSTGEPTFWPRSLPDELSVAWRFEQVFHDSFFADQRATLAVVCFPLGTWVGGLFTTSSCRHLAAKGYPLTVVAPGNNKAEILRVVRSLAPDFEQTVLLGYPPFLKDVVDAGLAEGVPWRDYRVKLVLAGEVISEEWRDLMAERAGLQDPVRDSASLYGTADAGVLGNETPLSIAIRRFLARDPAAARALFGQARLPTLVQYDPCERYFEAHEGTLVFSGDNGVPLVRYHISDEGGVVPYATMLERLRALGFDAEAEVGAAQGRFAGTGNGGGAARGARALPFVYVFGRSHFAVSYYGANVFPDTVTIGLEQPSTREFVTGKFVLEVREGSGHDPELGLAVELSPRGVGEPPGPLADAVAEAVLAALWRLNSEFTNYVPAERQRPRVTLWPPGHPEYFPVGVKHRYSRSPAR